MTEWTDDSRYVTGWQPRLYTTPHIGLHVRLPKQCLQQLWAGKYENRLHFVKRLHYKKSLQFYTLCFSEGTEGWSTEDVWQTDRRTDRQNSHQDIWQTDRQSDRWPDRRTNRILIDKHKKSEIYTVLQQINCNLKVNVNTSTLWLLLIFQQCACRLRTLLEFLAWVAFCRPRFLRCVRYGYTVRTNTTSSGGPLVHSGVTRVGVMHPGRQLRGSLLFYPEKLATFYSHHRLPWRVSPGAVRPPLPLSPSDATATPLHARRDRQPRLIRRKRKVTS